MAAAIARVRATSSGRPTRSLAKATTPRIEAEVTMMTAAMRAASSTNRRSKRRRPVSAVAAGRRARSSSSQLPHRAAKVCNGRGSFRSTHAAIGSDARIIQGVRSVLRAETATATGYRSSPVACSARPSPAIMKESSPIWARLSPACTDVRIPLPVRNAPSETPTTFPMALEYHGRDGRHRQDDRQGREERVRVLHGGKCYTGPSVRDRVTRFADGAGAGSRCRGPLVVEQLARSHPQRATQTIDRIGPNQTEPSARTGESVDRVEAEARELGEPIGGEAVRFEQLSQPQAQQAPAAIADFLTPILWP